jgi:mannosylglycerate hydrolase MGH1-like protein/glycosyl hydrolase family 63
MPPSEKPDAPQSRSNAETERLAAAAAGAKPWRQWGTYLSERQWGTVREDYSADGSAWEYLPHDHARSRAYRWGEDGIAGFSDAKETLCLGIALWNGNDPILKERLFGLTNSQGNHGEDVKELYYYLDATPTCSYARMLYKYPQAAYPYQQLIDENQKRGLNDREYELIDTGIFAEDRYFDVFVEYAKADVSDILLRVTVYNRGPEPASLVLLPHVWFRNTWSWGRDPDKPELTQAGRTRLQARHECLGSLQVDFDTPDEFLFTENETNAHRLFNSGPADGYFKDAFHEYVVHGAKGAVNPAKKGTKAAALYRLNLAPGASATIRVRMRAAPAADDAFSKFDQVFADRLREADAFYNDVHAGVDGEDARRVQRQALAGMLWNRQCYHYNVFDWLQGDPGQPPPPQQRRSGRNSDWQHLNGDEVLSMPDKWEYPWFAAWDLGFHCVSLSLVDPAFAKRQLVLLGREWYMHPNGQYPAYEWNFGDVNPPVHAFAAWQIYRLEQLRTGKGDRQFLERMFHKLMLNFMWWVNREDAQGRNIFQGGFLGLDNIGVFDRSEPLPTGGTVNQSDGTAWMAMYALNLMRIALELARENHIYEDAASKFFEHFLYISRSMSDIAGQGIGLWDETDNFYYSVINLPTGQNVPIRVRSMVGLIPLFAVEVIEQEMLEIMPNFRERLNWFLDKRPDLASLVSRWKEPGSKSRRLLALARAFRMKNILARMLDENEFLSPYGIRALSKYHRAHPYVVDFNGSHYEVDYDPAESRSRIYGGNSNWRGPIWMPVNYLIVESLRRFYDYYGDEFKVECPTNSGRYLTLWEVAEDLACRLMKLCLRDDEGRRASTGDDVKQQTDPNFRDYLQFYEYFHGDNGRGMGANHQTGWTGLVANLIAEHGQARQINPNK